MPKVNIEGFGAVTFPDDMTQEQITSAIENEILPSSPKFGPRAPRFADRVKQQEAADRELYSPTSGSGFWQNALEGSGKAYVDTGRAGKQLLSDNQWLGKIPGPIGNVARSAIGSIDKEGLQSEIDESRKLDAPLMDTAGGVTGNIGSKVLMSVPSLAIPGSQTILGAGAIGAGMGAAEPVATGESRAKNIAIGTLAGAGGQKTANIIGQGLKNRAIRKAAEMTALRNNNAVKDEVFREARELGYVASPAKANPTIKNQLLEGAISGGKRTSVAASTKNQQLTNKIAREELGLPKDAPLTSETMKRIRDEEGKVYELAKNLGTFTIDKPFTKGFRAITKDAVGVAKEIPNRANNQLLDFAQAYDGIKNLSSRAVVTEIKALREAAKDNFRNGSTELGRMQIQTAKLFEDLMDRNIEKTKDFDFLKTFRRARKRIAKAHSIDDVLDDAGNVDLIKLNNMYGDVLEGKLKTAAKFAGAFGDNAAVVKNNPSNFSVVDTVALGTASGLTANPMLMAGVFARPLTRMAILSKPYQKYALTPSYDVGALTRISPKLANSRLLQRLAPSSTAATASMQND